MSRARRYIEEANTTSSAAVAAVSAIARSSWYVGTWPDAQRIGIAIGAVNGKSETATLSPLPGSGPTTVTASS